MDEGLAEVIQIPVTGGATTVLGTLPANTAAPYYVAISNGVVAWSSVDTSVIPAATTFFSGPVGQKGTQRFAVNPGVALSAVALDPTGTVLYYLGGSSGYQLNPCTLATGTCSAPLGPSEAFGFIALNSTYVFWGDANGNLNRLAVSSGGVVNFQPGSVIPGVAGIALDTTNVYWVAPGGGEGTAGILGMPQGGGAISTIWSESTTSGSLAGGASSVPENSLTTDGIHLFFDVSNYIQYVSNSGSASPTDFVAATPDTAVALPVYANGAIYYIDGSTIYGVRPPP